MQGQLILHDMNNALTLSIEALLFYKGGTSTIAELAKILTASKDDIDAALVVLKETLAQRGVRLVREGDAVGLVTAPEAAALIESMRREEIEGPLGRAGLETLAVILYRGTVTRADIEYIRGVNASQILRSLTMRGLVERIENPNDKRSFLYRATADVPAYLGVSEIKDLPEYQSVMDEINAVLNARDTAQSEEPQ